MNKISICTVCMNRLKHLSKTLPVNIAENIHHPNVEFVILDYNSRDNMENWAKETIGKFIEMGIVKYYKTCEPKYFNMSHSKNMTLKLATGDIVCMIDADNYAGPGYADWIDAKFAANGENSVITTLRKSQIPYRDQGGKVGFARNLVHSVSGFDESLTGYGIDDVDLINRLEKAGGKRVFIEDEKYLRYIGHSNMERLINYHLFDNLDIIYVYFVSSERFKVLYLLKDHTFIEAKFNFNEALKHDWLNTYWGFSMQEGSKREGAFTRENGVLQLKTPDHPMEIVNESAIGMLGTADAGRIEGWRQISPENELYHTLIIGYGECINRVRYFQNDRDDVTINARGWGRGTVYLNFDMSTPIQVS
ncbi:glycosyltransferase [Flavitalea sp. BT771]|uniref:glycosyltransferase family 2 protein n=1 Tax=Flavitalea sp. BT771 TaxID=3063329 RepID=UPI0026E135C5|nr:glycosyltransferase family 2 protein [Flavitalea sp. BT771]MDO6434626.1 glycosyltransferase [Flavitalea sp. BT771]MDV6223526.1 glycosyltransferase [Flavitalea sp. BT771]